MGRISTSENGLKMMTRLKFKLMETHRKGVLFRAPDGKQNPNEKETRHVPRAAKAFSPSTCKRMRGDICRMHQRPFLEDNALHLVEDLVPALADTGKVGHSLPQSVGKVWEIRSLRPENNLSI
jgi:hypothetical protein